MEQNNMVSAETVEWFRDWKKENPSGEEGREGEGRKKNGKT